MKITAIDLFCGAGGLTHGLQQVGIDVKAGIDVDACCQFPYESNNASEFILRDVQALTSNDLQAMFNSSDIRLLAGCAPCQPFSTYSQGRRAKKDDDRWKLLNRFVELVDECRPELVTMENVMGLQRHTIFSEFVKRLQGFGYHVNCNILFGPKYGLPQTRKRLVVLASRLGWPELHKPDSEPVTVRDAIGLIDSLEAGECHSTDILHRASGMSDIQKSRLLASTPGGSWRDWPEHLKAACHASMDRTSYISVYGRMEWDQPSPTITTQFYGIGHGRFGHPDQLRAITPREAAILQGFPAHYSFFKEPEDFAFNRAGRMIGNAVPVPLGALIGESFTTHVNTRA